MGGPESGSQPGKREFYPAEERLKSVIRDVVTEAEQAAWPAVLNGLKLEVAEQVNDEYEIARYNAKSAYKFWHQLDGVEQKINDSGEFLEKSEILALIAELKPKLEIL